MKSKNRFLVSVFACVVAVCSASANAGYITSNGTLNLMANFQVDNPGGNPPLLEIVQITLDSGQLYTNQVNGSPFQPGSIVRTVGVTQLITGIDGTANTNNFLLVSPNNNPVYAVFAVEGVISPGALTADFSAGSIFFVEAAVNTLDVLDPTTWDITSPIATYVLSAPDIVLPGSGFGISPAGNEGPIFPPNVNRSQGLQGQNQGDGTFAFGSDDPSNLFSNVELDNGGFADPHFLIASTSQLIQPDIYTMGALQLAAMNAIGLAAGFTGNFDAGGYDPTNPQAVGATGDFNAGFKGDLFVASAQTVPEPTSIAIMALGGLCIGLSLRRRKI